MNFDNFAVFAPFLFSLGVLWSTRANRKERKELRVTGLHIYPVKSCKGIAVDSWPVSETGLLYDRAFMIVEKATGKFITQRQKPKLCFVQPHISADGVLSLTVPHSDVADASQPTTITVGKIESPELDNGAVMRVNIWGEEHEGRDAGDEVADWLSRFIGVECRLVKMHPNYVRGLDSNWTKNVPNDAPLRTGFADGFPFLLTSEASLAQVQEWVCEANNISLADVQSATIESSSDIRKFVMQMDRFRPNITVNGDEPFEEDTWGTIRIGGSDDNSDSNIFYAVKPCSRCVITTTDQQTAKLGTEPLKTFNVHRIAYKQRDGKLEKSLLFGENLVHKKAGGILRINDRVLVLQKKQSPLIRTSDS